MIDRLRGLPVLVWFLIPTIIVAGFGVWYFTTADFGKTDPDKPLPVSKNVLGTQDVSIVSREHVAFGTSPGGYDSNPPTSGKHWPEPAKSGIYDKQLPDEQVLHNLEHGHIWISYNPFLLGLLESKEATGAAKMSKQDGQKVLDQLKEIVKKDSWKVVLEPREKDDTIIALAAWGRLLKLDSPDYGKVKDFIKTYRNRGPEQTPE